MRRPAPKKKVLPPETVEEDCTLGDRCYSVKEYERVPQSLASKVWVPLLIDMRAYDTNGSHVLKQGCFIAGTVLVALVATKLSLETECGR